MAIILMGFKRKKQKAYKCVFRKNKMADSIHSLEKALVKAGLELTPQQRNSLLKLTATTPYSEKRIIKFVQGHSLSLDDAIYCIEIAAEYSAKLHKISEVINEGYSPDQLSEFMQIKEEVKPSDISPQRVIVGEDLEFWPPDLSEYISYQNMIFLDEMAGRNHDMTEVRELIGQIGDRINEAHRNIGVGVVVHRMRQIYEAQKLDSKEGVSGFDNLLNRALGYIPKEFYVSQED